MRIKNDKENISYDNTKIFFKNRIKKYKGDNPYSLTMYQDNNPELVKERNIIETEKLLPKLQLDEYSKVLDVACGIGRWSDAITCKIEKYCGLDFCEDFIKLAKERNIDVDSRHFYVSKNEQAADTLIENNEGKFNRVLFIGCFLYLNDDDVINTMKTIETVCEEKTIICIREPIGIIERLTLKEQFSEELNDEYNAIYRTRNEFNDFFIETVLKQGFSVAEEGFLFEKPDLNNRKETSQYYFILKR